MESSNSTPTNQLRRVYLMASLGLVSGLTALLIVLAGLTPARLVAHSVEVSGRSRTEEATATVLPMLLPFQGRLSTSDGKSVPEGQASAVFALYDTPTGGGALWSSGLLKLKVSSGGLVNATLGGETNPLDRVDFSREIYLGVKVDDPGNTIPLEQELELLPRVRILPTLHARRADFSSETAHATKADDSKTVQGVNPLTGLVPVGTIVAFAGKIPPKTWAFCDGAELDPKQYPNLFNVIGTTYGGDGEKSIKLPNLVSRFPLGAGSVDGLTARNLGDIAGSETHTLSVAELPPHKHSGTTGLGSPGFYRVVYGSGGGVGNNHVVGHAGGGQTKDYNDANMLGSAHTHNFTTDAGAGCNSQAFGTLPPFSVVNYIIKVVD